MSLHVLVPGSGSLRSVFRVGLLATVVLTLMSPRAGATSLSEPVVFVSRDLGNFTEPPARQTSIVRASTARLLVREVDGTIRDLLERQSAAIADVSDPDVSFDGARIVFAGYSTSDNAWRIFEIGADGQGLRQLTTSDLELDLTRFGEAAASLAGYDDFDPCYLPDGRICFVSTRNPAVAPDERLRSTNLYLVNADGSDVHRITSERFGADTPTVEPTTGQIVYSRWWRTGQPSVSVNGEVPVGVPPGSPGYGDVPVPTDGTVVLTGIAEEDFPGINTWFLSSIDPDGTNLAMYTGFRLDRELTQAYRPSFIDEGEVAALFIPQTPILGYPGENGIRLYEAGPSRPRTVAGPQQFPISLVNVGADGQVIIDADVIDPALPPGDLPRPRDMAPFVYNSVVGMGGDALLVSAAPTDRPGLDYGLYIIEEPGEEIPLPVLDLPGTAELDAVLLTPRQRPPIIEDGVNERLDERTPRAVAEAIEQNGTFTFSALNIFGNAPVNVDIPNAPPIGEPLEIEFYMNTQRTSTTASDEPILIARREIPPDGKVEIDLPAGVPLFEVLRRPDETIPIGRDGQIFHVGGMNFGRAGEKSECIGCHAGHSALTVPEDFSLTNVAPSAFVDTTTTRQNRRGPLFSPPKLVDRQTGFSEVVWAANPTSRDEVIRLRFGATVSATELVLHAVTPEGVGDNLRIEGIRIQTLDVKGEVTQEISHAAALEAAGTRIALDPEVEFSSLVITIPPSSVSGTYAGVSAPALAEIELIGQATSEARGSFRRGDVDCNGVLEITDPIALLTHLFLGQEFICCKAAGDANADNLLDISDSITMLSFMFLGGPFIEGARTCEPVASSPFTCSQPFCTSF